MHISWRALAATALLAAGGAAVPSQAQNTLDFPVGMDEPYWLDTGPLANLDAKSAIVFDQLVRVDGASWLRLFFGRALLEPGSFVRITSLMDGEVQELDGPAMAVWSHASAYFNGDSVYVELIAAPQSAGNRLIIDGLVKPAPHPIGGQDNCGVCGADDRVSSSEEWTCRLLPAGCTASIYNTDSCMVTAGHCIGGSMTLQFNVPASNPNCSLNFPPVADQFPVVANDFENNGVGDDWGVLIPGTNNLGETPYERYGVFRPIAASPGSNGQTVEQFGYGVDATCTLSQTQQTSSGSISAVLGDHYQHNVDTQGGNSGSALLRNDEIIGITTHCSVGCPNFSTRVDVADFALARDVLCGEPPEPPVNDECEAAIDLGSGAPQSVDFNNALATSGTDGAPFLSAACDQFGDSPGIRQDVWWLWTAPSGGDARFHTCGGGLDTKMAVYEDAGCPVAAASEIACSDDEDCPGGGTESDISVPVTGGTTYRIRVGAWGTDAGGQGPAGAGTLFIEFTSDPVAGACCVGESCFELTDLECGNAGGVFQGPGTDCSNDPCAPPEGACCLTNGDCLVLDEATCGQVAGLYQGDDTDCAGVECAVPCPWDLSGGGGTPDGVVGIVDLLELLAAWGPNPGHPADFDGDGSVGITDLLKLLASWGDCP